MICDNLGVAGWSFLTSHARVLPCIARDPDVRLRDSAARTGVTERTAYGIVTDLTETRYVVKHKDGRRNRYQIQAHLALPWTDSRERAIGEILALLAGADAFSKPGSDSFSIGVSAVVVAPARRAAGNRAGGSIRHPGAGRVVCHGRAVRMSPGLVMAGTGGNPDSPRCWICEPGFIPGRD
jgi:hypothetical protein